MPESKLKSLFVIPEDDKQTKTFKEDERLPSLPLPEIGHSLQRYLDSVKPFVTSDEYKNTVRIVEAFEKGIGKQLNEKLKKKSQKERNWVEKWWEDFAYLSVREPLIPFCNMDGVQPDDVISNWTYNSQEDQIEHASRYVHYMLKFWKLLREEGLKPTTSGDKTFSMSQFRRLYNTVRIPGKDIDSLVSYFRTAQEGPCPPTVVVICKGRLFRLEAIDENGEEATPPELQSYFWEISNSCARDVNNNVRSKGVGILTCDTRTKWSYNRKYLQSLSRKNEEILKTIETSSFVVVLDDDAPSSPSEVTNCNLCGDYNNRWADKSMVMIYYKNGRAGGVCDHTAFDGIASISCMYYGILAVQEEQGMWDAASSTRKKLNVTEMEFDLDPYVVDEMERVDRETSVNKKIVLMTRHSFDDYGKTEIQKYKLHPDSYVQMALQLAYYRLHKKPAPCYETATTREFYNGRTETLRACTTQCLLWVHSMLDEKFSDDERNDLLRKAVKRHDQLMNEARENSGCDRHLFGLYCTALEEGLEIPELYSDPSYQKSGGGGNFILSTSCVGYSPLGGGVAPMCKDGYGIFYNIMNNKIQFTISVNTTSKETNAAKYFDSLRSSFLQMRQVLQETTKNTSKL